MKQKKNEHITHELEKGGAGIKIVLADSTITVYHSGDNSILHEVKQVPEGSWNKIWEAIREIQSAKNPVKSDINVDIILKCLWAIKDNDQFYFNAYGKEMIEKCIKQQVSNLNKQD